MKTKSILILATIFECLLIVQVVVAEGPPVEWEKTFGGSGSDYAGSVQQTTDGGYIIAGRTDSYGAGSWDVWLIKTDPNGIDIWNKTFGGSGNDYADSVRQTTDGGYIIAGTTNSFGAGSYDVWLIKTDADGNDIWKKTFGGSFGDEGYSVQQTIDGGYIVAGWTSSYGVGLTDAWLIKTDADGNEIWNKTFGGSKSDQAYCVQQTTDGGYIISGLINFALGNMWLIKTDADGNKMWDKSFGGGSMEAGYSVQETTDGGYIIAGRTDSYGSGPLDVWFIKTDANGNDIWKKTFGGSGSDFAYSVQQTVDGGYILAGSTNSYGAGSWDIWLIKTDTDGNKIWNKTFGGSSDERGFSVQQTTDGGYIVTGNFISDVYLIKLSADCIDQPRSDLTGDCKVDFRDFAVMASEWLICGLDPSMQCWE